MLIAGYVAHLEYLGRARKTVERRCQTLSLLERWLAPVELADATLDQLEAFASRYANPATRRAYVCDMRSFYGWAHRRAGLDHDPAADLEPVSVPETEVNAVPPADVARLLASATAPATKLMVALAALAGLRVSEVAALRGKDVKRGALVIPTSKMGKGRTIPLAPELGALLAGVGPGLLFPGLTPRLAPALVSRRIQRLMNRCDLADYTPHNLRASFATEMSRRVDPWTLQRLLGHKSVSTTQRYVRPRDAEAELLANLYGAAA